MANSKSKRSPNRSDRDPTQESPSGMAHGTSADDRSPNRLPGTAARTWLSIWLALHLFALAISFTSVVEPSNLHAQLLQFFRPYLRSTHFGADDRPVYLTHAQPLHQPHRLQVTTSQGELTELSPNAWQPLDPLGDSGSAAPGLAASDRYARWLSTVALLAQNEQPSLVAELLLPVVEDEPEWTGIRLRRLPTDLNDVRAEAQTQYIARIVRRGESVALVQLRERRLSADATPGNRDTTEMPQTSDRASGKEAANGE